ncbi:MULTISPECIES: DUF3994 domain-containing protein [Bacillus cereus group]|uniref:DUF3994 domain-containing protein n=1 Tax=Bacillus cereus group TaxID=86661 RepID=UPI00032E2DD3|nr:MULTISPECIES: hypothetical protein [Bacillus cereus group]EOP59358.1 hypothetical protein IIW_04913 [Bacillus cereus VD136]EOP75683.1 hypothetical protein KOW_05378 [Bacillus cereus VDM006]EOQ08741.1 hypothetical protein KOY_05231 [Bacillus cereus VDM021]OOG89806.1 hypothetical protein BTH41_04955 [Bacillus mycoides]PEL24372.1 hypothetical protein CN608_18355 [Bacillus pseudomycoides]
MKAKRLITLALPIMLLGGCATDKAETKTKDKVEEKAVTKEKIEKDKYPDHMYKIRSDLELELNKFMQIAAQTKDKSNDILKLNKELYAKETEIQEIITKFHKIEPPKEFEKEHETILKGVDCYSESFTLIVKSAKSNSITKEKTQKSKDLVLKGNDYLKEGYTPLSDYIADRGEKRLKQQESTKNSEFPKYAKEFVGEWGHFEGSEFVKAIDFKEDGTYTIFDDKGKTSFEDNHMTGKWSYKPDSKQFTMTIGEYVKDGQKVDSSQMHESVDYTLEIFFNDYLNMVDAKGNRIDVQKRK